MNPDISASSLKKIGNQSKVSHNALKMSDQMVSVFSQDLPCVSQQEGLLKGIREESWNQHRDLEKHSGVFSGNLIQPVEAE